MADDMVRMGREDFEEALRKAAQEGAAQALEEREREQEQLRAALELAEEVARKAEAAWEEAVAAAPMEEVMAPEDMVLTYQGVRVELRGGVSEMVPAPHAALLRGVLEERAALERLKEAMASKWSV